MTRCAPRAPVMHVRVTVFLASTVIAAETVTGFQFPSHLQLRSLAPGQKRREARGGPGAACLVVVHQSAWQKETPRGWISSDTRRRLVSLSARHTRTDVAQRCVSSRTTMSPGCAGTDATQAPSGLIASCRNLTCSEAIAPCSAHSNRSKTLVFASSLDSYLGTPPVPAQALGEPCGV